MRTIFALCAIILVIGGFSLWRATQLPSRFGEFSGAPQVAVSDLVGKPQGFLGKPVSVEGTVREQCQSMGCFFFLPSPSGMLRVELKDIAMHAPMREGRTARVEGQLVPYNGGYELYANAVEFQ